MKLLKIKSCPSLLRIAFCLALATIGPTATAVAPIATDISDTPLPVLNRAAPNIMFLLDDSGSMANESLTGTSVDSTGAYSSNNLQFYNKLVNKIYYDPNVTYTPGFNIDYTTTSSTYGKVSSMGNASLAATPSDPYRTWANSAKGAPATAGAPVNIEAIQCYWNSSTTFPPWPISTATNGSSTKCQTSSSGTYTYQIRQYSFYYDYTGGSGCLALNSDGSLPLNATGSNIPGSSCFTRREIRPSTASYTRTSARTDCTSAPTCTYAEEIQNFANWYAYYRQRVLTLRSAIGRAFQVLDNNYRVGFETINDSSGSEFSPVANFTAANKVAWYATFYGNVPGGTTPSRSALKRIGDYYKGPATSTSGVYGYTPKPPDPIQYSCQQNFTIFSTDGYWNGDSSFTFSDVDGVNVPTLPTSDLATPPTATQLGLTAGSLWPYPYRDTTKTANTLSDIAAYYWVTDLRTTGALATNNVPFTDSDPASWQHMTTYAVSIGAHGTLDPIADVAGLKAGTTHWPVAASDTNTAVDDLWHAAVNGHGQFFSAKDPTTLESSLVSILLDISKRNSASAAVAVSNPYVVSTADNTVYASSYVSGVWTGDLKAYPIDLTTGAPNLAAPVWSSSAETQLNSRTPTDRYIVTHTGSSGGTGQGIQFQPTSATTTTKLSSTQQNLLNSTTSPPGPSDGADVVAYLRGDQSKENTTYRKRAALLGDIVDAEPVVVHAPSASYADDCYANVITGKCTQSFKTAQASRASMVFQGANDGMMHGFLASSGAESWAYIPALLLPTLTYLTPQDGFVHHYYVDGPAITGDVDFAKTSGASGNPDWRTILVSGLGKGGRGYFALDVTTPNAASESDAAAKVLWEFPNAGTDATSKKNVGYSYGRPILVKTTALGWVVLVTSGVNNGAADTGGTGHGYLYALNPKTGEVLATLDTAVGDDGTGTAPTGPSGLARISAYVENTSVDNTVQYVYGGDLLGYVWRFDLTAAATSGWTVTKLARLVDSSGNAQPVTTEPELAAVASGGTTKRFVYVGTGRYLGVSDIPVTGTQPTQTMYGLIDDRSNPTGGAAVITPLRSSLQQMILSNPSNPTTGAQRTITAGTTIASAKGWYIDMPSNGERIVTNPVAALGTLVFTSNIPSNNVCIPGGQSWFNAVDYSTGAQVAGASWASLYMGEVLSSAPTLIQLANKSVKAEINRSNQSIDSEGVPVTPTSGVGRHVSWREVILQ